MQREDKNKQAEPALWSGRTSSVIRGEIREIWMEVSKLVKSPNPLPKIISDDEQGTHGL